MNIKGVNYGNAKIELQQKQKTKNTNCLLLFDSKRVKLNLASTQVCKESIVLNTADAGFVDLKELPNYSYKHIDIRFKTGSMTYT